MNVPVVEVTDEDFADLPRTAGALDEDTRAILALVIDSETAPDWHSLVKAAFQRNDEAAAEFLATV